MGQHERAERAEKYVYLDKLHQVYKNTKWKTNNNLYAFP